MLVLSRKVQEKIQIGNEITITVLRVQGSSVRIGIEAPRSVRVLRSELPVNDEVAQSTTEEPRQSDSAEPALLDVELTFELPNSQTPMADVLAVEPTRIAHRARPLPRLGTQPTRIPGSGSESRTRRLLSPTQTAQPGSLRALVAAVRQQLAVRKP